MILPDSTKQQSTPPSIPEAAYSSPFDWVTSRLALIRQSSLPQICAGSPTMEVCLGSVGMDSGKDKPLLSLPAQTSGYRDYCPSKVAGLLQISEFSLCSESSPRRSVSIAKGVAERKQRRREKRVRARENVMIQMYNNNRHSGLDSSLARLRCSFQRCSIVSWCHNMV